MSTQKRKFELFAKLLEMGFTYEEAFQLRRIEMTLRRWSERECGDGSDWGIERDETTGKPFNVYHGEGKSRRYPIADREGGALKRLARITAAYNARHGYSDTNDAFIHAYHQTDPRGCALYLVRHECLRASENMVVRKAIEYGMKPAIKSAQTAARNRPLYESPTYPGLVDETPEKIARRYLREKNVPIPNRETLPIDQYYLRGLAVCA